ncbi:phage DNA methylase, partial [mine drainage metagenome]
MLGVLRKLPCAVILSGYPSGLYDEELPGWRSLELQVMNQAGVRTEKLWFNFAPDRVHWARYAGRDHTHRQTIK